MTSANDGGAREHAMGDSARGADGVYSYQVVKGDIVSNIASRFGLCMDDLYTANPGLQGHEDELRVGEILSIQYESAAAHPKSECLIGPQTVPG